MVCTKLTVYDLTTCEQCKNYLNATDGCGIKTAYCSGLYNKFGVNAAVSCEENTPMLENEHRVENSKALPFILAGKCKFTVLSHKTGAKFTYTMKKKKSTHENGSEYIYYISTSINNEDVYCGVIFFNEMRGKFLFAQGSSGKVEASDVRIKSILYILNNLYMEKYSMELSVFHCNRCGRCGKILTTPESILTGLGPECSKLCGIPRVKLDREGNIKN